MLRKPSPNKKISQMCLKFKTKQDREIYDFLMELFDNLPLFAMVNNKFLCIQGGISTDFLTLTQFNASH